MERFQKLMIFFLSTVILKTNGILWHLTRFVASVFSLITSYPKTGPDFMKQKSQNWFFYKTPCFMNLHNYAEYLCIWYERTINFGLWFKKTIVIKTSSVSWNLHSKSERKLEFNLWRYLIEHEKNQSTENNISLLLFVGVFGLQCRTGDVQSWSDDPSAMCKILHWRSCFHLRVRAQGPQRTSVQYRLRFQSQDVKYCFTFFLCHLFSPWSII